MASQVSVSNRKLRLSARIVALLWMLPVVSAQQFRQDIAAETLEMIIDTVGMGGVNFILAFGIVFASVILLADRVLSHGKNQGPFSKVSVMFSSSLASASSIFVVIEEIPILDYLASYGIFVSLVMLALFIAYMLDHQHQRCKVMVRGGIVLLILGTGVPKLLGKYEGSSNLAIIVGTFLLLAALILCVEWTPGDFRARERRRARGRREREQRGRPDQRRRGDQRDAVNEAIENLRRDLLGERQRDGSQRERPQRLRRRRLHADDLRELETLRHEDRMPRELSGQLLVYTQLVETAEELEREIRELRNARTEEGRRNREVLERRAEQTETLIERTIDGIIRLWRELPRRRRRQGEDEDTEYECLNCGAPLRAGDNRCPSCGAEFEEDEDETPTEVILQELDEKIEDTLESALVDAERVFDIENHEWIDRSGSYTFQVRGKKTETPYQLNLAHDKHKTGGEYAIAGEKWKKIHVTEEVHNAAKAMTRVIGELRTLISAYNRDLPWAEKRPRLVALKNKLEHIKNVHLMGNSSEEYAALKDDTSLPAWSTDGREGLILSIRHLNRSGGEIYKYATKLEETINQALDSINRALAAGTI